MLPCFSPYETSAALHGITPTESFSFRNRFLLKQHLNKSWHAGTGETYPVLPRGSVHGAAGGGAAEAPELLQSPRAQQSRWAGRGFGEPWLCGGKGSPAAKLQHRGEQQAGKAAADL